MQDLYTGRKEISCVGVVEERYWNKLGNVIEFMSKMDFIKNIQDKINKKSVDKIQESAILYLESFSTLFLRVLTIKRLIFKEE